MVAASNMVVAEVGVATKDLVVANTDMVVTTSKLVVATTDMVAATSEWRCQTDESVLEHPSASFTKTGRKHKCHIGRAVSTSDTLLKQSK
ncbi:hypothetical protein Hamer_G004136 [Homarus americanus]|uniref:Uncharacterized protein n=1 Tax=Homarus americanus TaxID=6706 RepID=A0A8J5MQ91_HOMAM|nr:hypothetical protein Hamer_G004136 [Homarus americanus]